MLLSVILSQSILCLYDSLFLSLIFFRNNDRVPFILPLVTILHRIFDSGIVLQTLKAFQRLLSTFQPQREFFFGLLLSFGCVVDYEELVVTLILESET